MSDSHQAQISVALPGAESHLPCPFSGIPPYSTCNRFSFCWVCAVTSWAPGPHRDLPHAAALMGGETFCYYLDPRTRRYLLPVVGINCFSVVFTQQMPAKSQVQLFLKINLVHVTCRVCRGFKWLLRFSIEERGKQSYWVGNPAGS